MKLSPTDNCDKEDIPHAIADARSCYKEHGSVWFVHGTVRGTVEIMYEDENGIIPVPLCDKLIQIDDVAGDEPELYCYIRVAPGVIN